MAKMETKQNELLQQFFLMNSGTPKPSERFHHAQIKGGFAAEKRFATDEQKGKFKSLIKSALPGVMLILRTNVEVQKTPGYNEYIAVMFIADPEEFVPIAKLLATIPIVYDIYCITYSADMAKWNPQDYGHYTGTVRIPAPDFTVRRFSTSDHRFANAEIAELLSNFAKTRFRQGRTERDLAMYRQYLGPLPIQLLTEIYAERYFLQVLLREYSVPMQDIDAFFFDHDDQIYMMEIKQKDATPQGEFGWDTHRLAWYYYLMKHSTINGAYLVGEIHDREERKHKDWYYIDLDDFCRATRWNQNRNGVLLLAKTAFTKIK